MLACVSVVPGAGMAAREGGLEDGAMGVSSSSEDERDDSTKLMKGNFPTIQFSCRSSCKDGADSEFEVTSDTSSLCSVSGEN